MKKSTLLVLAMTCFAQSVIASGEMDTTKFTNQSTWKEVLIKSTTEQFTFKGLRTDRGTFRIWPNSGVSSVPYSLKVSFGGEGKQDWISKCGSKDYRNKFKGFRDAKFRIEGNPFAHSHQYVVTGENLRHVPLTMNQVENAPEVGGINISIEGNEFHQSSLLHRGGEYENYLENVQQALNSQLKDQRESFMSNGKFELDFSTPELKGLACDLALKWANLTISFEVHTERAKILQYSWIARENFEQVYQQVISSSSERILNVFQTGMIVGSAMEKFAPGVDPLATGRDEKLLKGLFKPDATNPRLFRAAELSDEQLMLAFEGLKEFDLRQGFKAKDFVTMDMASLEISVGE